MPPENAGYKTMAEAISVNLAYYRSHRDCLPDMYRTGHSYVYIYYMPNKMQQAIVEVGDPRVVEWDAPDPR